MRRWVLGGESYVALAEGLQDALWALGGVTEGAPDGQPVGGVPEPEARGAGGSDGAVLRRCWRTTG